MARPTKHTPVRPPKTPRQELALIPVRGTQKWIRELKEVFKQFELHQKQQYGRFELDEPNKVRAWQKCQKLLKKLYKVSA